MTTKKVEYRNCPACKQELKGWRVEREIRGRLCEHIEYNHKNPDYRHVTPFKFPLKCYNKKRGRPNSYK